MERRGIFFSGLALSCLYLLFLSSCVNTKKVTYFDGLHDTTIAATLEERQGLEPVIQKGDLLSISVNSISPDVTTVFNTANTPSSSGSLSGGNMLSHAVGYLVSQDGYMDFPMLGRLKVAGLSKESVKDLIVKGLEEKKLLFDPVVTVRYLNYHVTVLGEVKNPGVVTIPNEQVTVLEAIGMAGDLTIYGKRDNVLLLRKEGGQKIVRRLDLNSNALLNSPYYYLKSNDVIYVEPGKNKIESVSQGRVMLPVILSALSFMAIIVDRVVVR